MWYLHMNTLSELLLKATTLLALAFLATLVLRRAPAALRHTLWTATMAGLLLLPLAVLSSLNLHLLPASRPIAPTAIPTDTLEPLPSPTPLLSAIPTAPLPVPLPKGPTPFPWPALLAALWSLGSLLFLARMLQSARLLRRMQRTGTPAPAAWRPLLTRCQQQLALTRPVTLILSDNTAMPLTYSILRPVIVLPLSADTWPPAKREWVLLHELAHIARQDAAAQLLAAAARALWWFHPACHWALAQMELERERACDDRVLTLAATLPPTAYAETLVDIATAAVGRLPTAVTGLAMARLSTLERRIQRVLDPRPSRTPLSPRTAALLTLTVLAATTTLGILRPITSHAADAPTSHAADTATTKTLPGGVTIQLVALTTDQQSPWWTPTGEPAVPDCYVAPSPSFTADNGIRRLLLFKVTGLPNGASPVVTQIDHDVIPLDPPGTVINASRTEPLADHYSSRPCFPDDAAAGTARIGVALKPWATAGEGGWGQSGKTADGAFSIGQPDIAKQLIDASLFTADGTLKHRIRTWSDLVPRPDANGPAGGPVTPPREIDVLTVRIAHTFDLTQGEFRIVALDADGNEHPALLTLTGRNNGLTEVRAEFYALPRDKIKTLRLQTRPIEWVTFDGIALDPGTRPTPALKAAPTLVPAATGPAAERALEIIPADNPLKPGETGEYYVRGSSINRPGVYSLSGRKITVKQALTTAGFDTDAKNLRGRDADLIRRADDKEITISVHLQQLFDGTEADRYLQANDMIVVKATGPNERADAAHEMELLLAEREELKKRLDGLRFPETNPEVHVAQERIATLDVNIALLKLRLNGGAATKPAAPGH